MVKYDELKINNFYNPSLLEIISVFLCKNNERNQFINIYLNLLKFKSLRNKCICEIEIKTLIIY